MQPQTIDSRVERLETRVTALEKLPARMDAFALELSQFRQEVRAEFSATRSELREEIRKGDEAVISTLREEIRDGDEETRRLTRKGDEQILTQARVLHEEVISRLALIQESRPRQRKQRQ